MFHQTNRDELFEDLKDKLSYGYAMFGDDLPQRVVLATEALAGLLADRGFDYTNRFIGQLRTLPCEASRDGDWEAEQRATATAMARHMAEFDSESRDALLKLNAAIYSSLRESGVSFEQTEERRQKSRAELFSSKLLEQLQSLLGNASADGAESEENDDEDGHPVRAVVRMSVTPEDIIDMSETFAKGILPLMRSGVPLISVAFGTFIVLQRYWREAWPMFEAIQADYAAHGSGRISPWSIIDKLFKSDQLGGVRVETNIVGTDQSPVQA